MELIKVENLSYYYQDGDTKRYILNDISTTFEKGKFYAILGESGSGKTTFLSLLSALDEPKSGNIFYKDKLIKEIGFESYRRNNIGIIFQAYNLIPYMTAVENVLVAMDITENDIPKDKKSVAYNLLNYIGISEDKANRQKDKLSGGEQQRVAIARALSTNVDIILADEPTGNLDEEMENEIIGVFKKLAHEQDKCVIVVTHSIKIAKEADLIIKLRKGKIDLDE